jgi:hypothetical protein
MYKKTVRNFWSKKAKRHSNERPPLFCFMSFIASATVGLGSDEVCQPCQGSSTQKRPISVKRDLIECQKRPNIVSKEI